MSNSIVLHKISAVYNRIVGLILRVLPISFTFHHLFIKRCNALIANAINGGVKYMKENHLMIASQKL